MTDVEEQRWDRGVTGDMDHAQVVWEMALPGAHEEQPAGNTHTHRVIACWSNKEERISDNSNDDEDEDDDVIMIVKTRIHHVILIHLEAARIEALSPPKQERATARGMVQFITPNTWSANVWGNKNRSYTTPIQNAYSTFYDKVI